MSDKSFQSWVPRSAVEATMGVEVCERLAPVRAVIEGAPGQAARYADLPVDLFDVSGSFIGLGFDGEVFTMAEMAAHTHTFANEFAERLDLVVSPVFAANKTFFGFHVQVDGGLR